MTETRPTPTGPRNDRPTPQQMAIPIAIRHWDSPGSADLIHSALDNRILFQDEERRVLEAINAAAIEHKPESTLDAFVGAIQAMGNDHAADYLLRTANSIGSSDPVLFKQHLRKARGQHSALEAKVLVEKLNDRSINWDSFGSQMRELLAATDSDAPTPGFEVNYLGDPDVEPECTPPEFIVQDVLLTGFTVVSGKRKIARKTTFASALVQHVAAGRPFCGKRVAKKRVGVVQRDMPRGSFLEYERAIQEGAEIGTLRIPFVDERMDLSRPDDQRKLSQFIESHKLELLLIDSLSGVTSINPNDQQEMASVIRKFLLDEIRDRLKCSVMLICHPNRAGTSYVSGHMDAENAADTIMTLESTGQTGVINAKAIGRHDELRFSFRVDHLGPEGGGCRVALVEPLPSNAREKILSFLREKGGWFSANGITRGTGMNYNTVTKALPETLKEGVVEQRETTDPRNKQQVAQYRAV